MNNLAELTPVIYAALQTIRAPVRPEAANQDIVYGKNARAEAADFGCAEMTITKNRAAA